MLLARLDSVGDVLLTGPAARAVACSGAEVTFLASTIGAAAAALLPGVERVITYDAPWVLADAPPVNPAAFHALVDAVADVRPDQAFVFTSFHQSPLPLALALRLAGVPEIAAASVDYPGSLLDVRHHAVDGHEVDQALSLVARRGHHLPPGDTGALRIRRPLPSVSALAGPYVVIHPGAAAPARAIDPAVAADAARELTAAGWRVAVTGSAAEAALTAHVAGASGALDLAGRLDLAELAGVLDGAEALVAGNTGPAHLAAAVGTPVVSVFAPVVPAGRWAPWRVPLVLLGDQEISCAGCRARTCPLAEQPCVRSVTARSIVDAVSTLAGADRPTRQVVA